MNRTTCLLVLLLSAASFLPVFGEQVFETLNGVIPDDRRETAFLVYLKEPKQLKFRISDVQGKAVTNVKVVGVTLSSVSGVGVTDPNGVTVANLSEPGIYEVKLAKTGDGAVAGFRLDILDAGLPTVAKGAGPVPTPVPTPIPTSVPTSVPNPVSPTPATKPADSSPDAAPPVLTLKPAPAPTAPLPSYSLDQTPPQVSPAAGPAPTQVAVASPVATPAPIPAPDRSSAPVSSPPPALVKPAPTQASPVPPPGSPNPAAPVDRRPLSGEIWAVERFFPTGDGYLDPFQPVSVTMVHDLPSGIKPADVLKVSLKKSSGAVEAVPGQWWMQGTREIRFLPSKVVPGAVYHARLQRPDSGEAVKSFFFSACPAVQIDLHQDGPFYVADLTWPENPHLLPTPDSQAIQLKGAEVKALSGDVPVWSLKIDADLPPMGNHDGVQFSGRPFAFSIRIPQAMVKAEQPFQVRVALPISGRSQPVETARSTLSRKTTVDSLPDPVALPVAPAPAPLPALTSPEPALSPVVSPDPAVATVLPPVSSPIPPVSPISLPISSAPASPDSPAPFPVEPAPGLSAPVDAIANDPYPGGAKLGTTESPALKPVSRLIPFQAISNPGVGAQPAWEKSFSVQEADGPSISWPKGVKWDAQGGLWVVDSQNRRVIRFNPADGVSLTAFGKKGKEPGSLGLPMDITLDGDMLYVSDTSGHCLHVFHLDGTFVRSIGTWGVKVGFIDLPHGVDFSGGQLWVADRGNSRINRFSPDGRFRGSFGEKGELPGYLNGPVAVKVFGDRLCVLENKTPRVQFFSTTGKLVKALPLKDARDPVALDVDPWEGIWVADAEAKTVTRYDYQGKVLARIVPPNGPNVWIPTSVAVRADGLIAVGDGPNRSVHVFRLR
jgi:hypothetical protein